MVFQECTAPADSAAQPAAGVDPGTCPTRSLGRISLDRDGMLWQGVNDPTPNPQRPEPSLVPNLWGPYPQRPQASAAWNTIGPAGQRRATTGSVRVCVSCARSVHNPLSRPRVASKTASFRLRDWIKPKPVARVNSCKLCSESWGVERER